MKPGILIAIVAVLVVAIVVVVISTSKGPEATAPTSQKSEPLTSIEVSEDMGGVSGTITAINKNIIAVEALVLLKDTTKQPITHIVKVLVDENTEIIKTILPSTEEIIAKNGMVQPEKTAIKLSDLKVGDKIDVAADKFIAENIKNGDPINAVSISLTIASK
jgi:hypothetical protein